MTCAIAGPGPCSASSRATEHSPTPVVALFGAIVGAAAGVGGQLIGERYRRYSDRQMTGRGLAGSIEATLLMTIRREYIPLFEYAVPQIEQGQPVKLP